MTSSLRSRVVEAGARAMPGWDFASSPIEEQAEVVLDAMLSCLTENADEWAEETHVPTLVGGDALALLAVLGDPS